MSHDKKDTAQKDMAGIHIRKAGLLYPERTIVEVYSQGGSIIELRELIDKRSVAEKLGIKTEYKSNLGAAHIDVIFPKATNLQAARKLDAYFAINSENGFARAVENAVPPIQIKPESLGM